MHDYMHEMLIIIVSTLNSYRDFFTHVMYVCGHAYMVLK